MVAVKSRPKRDLVDEEKVGWRDDVKEEELFDEKMQKEVDFSVRPGVHKTERINLALLPDSPPHSPTKKEEQALADVDSDQKRSSSSRQASLSIESPKTDAKALRDGPTQFATDRPRAENKAFKTFERMKASSYQNAKVGRSKGHEKEAMVCDCRYRHGIDDPLLACTEEADCINRLTQVECLKSECNCGQYCQNQRFQKCQYADVEIIETEKKGFGLRAGSDISADAFIYEYIGEVVEQKEFRKRMEEYRDEGIRHFYFMMLQREEFLDATRKGGIARFVNHSCNPNCYVSKWHVGKFMRMGIFAKRDIQRGEELTFNYNVDRYGNDAQACFCGEPNCIGTIGGKTQTDIGGMEQLFIDALGISAQVDQLEAKGTRKKKSRHLDEDFTPVLSPIEEEDVAKVITALRQATSNRNILQKLLSRIHMTQNAVVQRCLVRLHGFVLMASVMEEWRDDKEIVLLVMGSLARWPLVSKNKVVDSGVDRVVRELSVQDDAEISSLSKDLLSAWDELEMSYRIARKETTTDGNSPLPPHGTSVDPRRKRIIEEEEEEEEKGSSERRSKERTMTLEDARAPNSISTRLDVIAPKREESGHPQLTPNLRQRGRTALSSLDSPSTPRTPDEYRSQSHLRPPPHFPSRSWTANTPNLKAILPAVAIAKPPVTFKAPAAVPLSIEEIIRNANASEALQRKQAEEEAAAAAAALHAKSKKGVGRRVGSEEASFASPKRSHSPTLVNGHGPSEKKMRGATTEKPSAEVAERRLKKFVSEVVVRIMSVYKNDLEKETFKKHAKELTNIISGKEMRGSVHWPPKDNFASGLSAEKTKKVKLFAVEYTSKLIARKGKGKSPTFTPHTPPRVFAASDTIETSAAAPANLIPTPSANGHLKHAQEEDEEEEEEESLSLQMSENGHEGNDQESSITTASPIDK
ncbi:hypothetical protein CBS101457_002372 [Exobasidium rhododendri]|nr:hypothetical protein CBS101457_002372 [Exobasidium rhododendri]